MKMPSLIFIMTQYNKTEIQIIVRNDQNLGFLEPNVADLSQYQNTAKAVRDHESEDVSDNFYK